jgi:hypothetical protein
MKCLGAKGTGDGDSQTQWEGPPMSKHRRKLYWSALEHMENTICVHCEEREEEFPSGLED